MLTDLTKNLKFSKLMTEDDGKHLDAKFDFYIKYYSLDFI